MRFIDILDDKLEIRELDPIPRSSYIDVRFEERHPHGYEDDQYHRYLVDVTFGSTIQSIEPLEEDELSLAKMNMRQAICSEVYGDLKHRLREVYDQLRQEMAMASSSYNSTDTSVGLINLSQIIDDLNY